MQYEISIVKKDLYRITTDDGRDVEVHMAVLDKEQCWTKSEMSEEKFTSVLRSESEYILKLKANALIERRAYSFKELYNKLYKYEPDKQLRLDVCEEFQRLGLINDETYAENLAYHFMKIKHSSLRDAEQKMTYIRGLDRKIARTALEKYEDCEKENLEYIFEHRYSRKIDNFDDFKQVYKVKSALLRLGFYSEDIDDVIKEAKESEETVEN